MVGIYVSFKKHSEYWLPEIDKINSDLKNFEIYLNNLIRKKQTTSTGKPIDKILLEYKEIIDGFSIIKNILCKSNESEEILNRFIIKIFNLLKNNILDFALIFFRGTKVHLKLLKSHFPEFEEMKVDKCSAQNTIEIIKIGKVYSLTVDCIYSYFEMLSIFRNICMNIKEGITKSNNRTSIWKL